MAVGGPRDLEGLRTGLGGGGGRGGLGLLVIG